MPYFTSLSSTLALYLAREFKVMFFRFIKYAPYLFGHALPHLITLPHRWYYNSEELRNETARTLTMHKISRNLHQNAVSCEVRALTHSYSTHVIPEHSSISFCLYLHPPVELSSSKHPPVVSSSPASISNTPPFPASTNTI